MYILKEIVYYAICILFVMVLFTMCACSSDMEPDRFTLGMAYGEGDYMGNSAGHSTRFNEPTLHESEFKGDVDMLTVYGELSWDLNDNNRTDFLRRRIGHHNCKVCGESMK